MNEKAKYFFIAVTAVICIIFIGAVIGYERDIHNYKKQLADSKEQSKRVTEELDRSLEANRDLRSTIDRGAAANREAAQRIRDGLRDAKNIDGIIDSVIYGLQQLEIAFQELYDNP